MKTLKYKKIFPFLLVFFISFPLLSQPDATPPPPVATNESWVDNVSDWYEENMNYLTITALMTIESSFIPFPSEIVIPPAAYAASQSNSKMNIPLIVLFATIGALLGAFINYFLALWLGRPVLYKLADSRLGRLMLLSGDKIEKAETYFKKKGNISTFVGRLIPGIRQLISVPAGLSKMNLLAFSLFTALGAGIWNIILALLGYVAHGQKDLINQYSHEIGILVVVILLGLGGLYLMRHLIKKRRN